MSDAGLELHLAVLCSGTMSEAAVRGVPQEIRRLLDRRLAPAAGP